MSTKYLPGTYTIKPNGSGQPSLYEGDGTTPLDDPDPSFFAQAQGNTIPLTFFFQIQDSVPLLFSQQNPITWKDLVPPSSVQVSSSRTIMTLNVTPAKEVTHHFQLNFEPQQANSQSVREEVLWSHDSTVILDPTIVENPPN